ncbi:hypothetical protein D9Q98_004273 [Chlorella vulgaris]|uniref:Uncharacterized protein n=1 Tax=Chlorella vulgaris TaxID=3077 RepID=A0A9D4YYW2_CHLVU|nr:hypothetical protein D9Q98_004273 [Chlorella vulgaris]
MASLNTTPLGSHDGAMVECTSPFSQTADASRSGHSTALQQRRRYPHAAEPPCTAGLPCHPNPASRVAADSTAAAAGSATVAAVQPASHAGVQAQALFPNAVLAALQRQVLQAAAGSASSIQLATQACIQRAQQATPPAPRRAALGVLPLLQLQLPGDPPGMQHAVACLLEAVAYVEAVTGPAFGAAQGEQPAKQQQLGGGRRQAQQAEKQQQQQQAQKQHGRQQQQHSQQQQSLPQQQQQHSQQQQSLPQQQQQHSQQQPQQQPQHSWRAANQLLPPPGPQLPSGSAGAPAGQAAALQGAWQAAALQAATPAPAPAPAVPAPAVPTPAVRLRLTVYGAAGAVACWHEAAADPAPPLRFSVSTRAPLWSDGPAGFSLHFPHSNCPQVDLFAAIHRYVAAAGAAALNHPTIALALSGVTAPRRAAQPAPPSRTQAQAANAQGMRVCPSAAAAAPPPAGRTLILMSAAALHSASATPAAAEAEEAACQLVLRQFGVG